MDHQIHRHEAGQIEGRGVIKEIFGQFVTTAFWKELAKTLAHEFFSMALMAFGGTLYWYGKTRKNKDVETSAPGIGGGGISDRAFGGGNESSYRPSTAFPVRPNPAGDNRFPGFN